MKPDSNQLQKWMRWIAQDADGKWWAYEHEPHLADISWYENEVGRSAFINKTSNGDNWKDTLQKIEH